MIPRAAELLTELETKKSSFLLKLDRLTDEQKSFRRSEGAWSTVQVADHVVRAERRSVDAIMKHHGMPSKTRNLKDILGYGAVWFVLKAGLKVKNPVPQAAPADQPDFEEIRQIWQGARNDLQGHLESLQVESLQDAAYRHPIAGPFTVEEALVFLNRHLAHHTRQLDRICQHPEFPRGEAADSGESETPELT